MADCAAPGADAPKDGATAPRTPKVPSLHTRAWSVHDGTSFAEHALSGVATSPDERRLLSEISQLADRQERRHKSKLMSAAASLRSFWLLDGKRLTSWAGSSKPVAAPKSRTPDASPRADGSVVSTARGGMSSSRSGESTAREDLLSSRSALSSSRSAMVSSRSGGVSDADASGGVSGAAEAGRPELQEHGTQHPASTPECSSSDNGGGGGSRDSGCGGSSGARDERLPSNVIEALRLHRLHVLRTWLDVGADVDATDQSGCTALHYAVIHPFEAAVELLIERGANLNMRDHAKHSAPILVAALRTHWGIVSRLLAAGADPDLPDGSGHTALMVASRAGDVGTVKKLLEHGAHAELADGLKNTALSYGVKFGHKGVAMVLRRQGKVLRQAQTSPGRAVQRTDKGQARTVQRV